jgi:hypothetical protein
MAAIKYSQKVSPAPTVSMTLTARLTVQCKNIELERKAQVPNSPKVVTAAFSVGSFSEIALESSRVLLIRSLVSLLLFFRCLNSRL